MAKHPLKKEELKEAFTMNCSPDNTVPPTKLGVIFRSIGRAPTNTQLQTLCKEFDSRGVRSLNYQQVEDILVKYEFIPENADTLREAFRIFDKEGSGTISCSEIRHILCNLGEKLSDEEVNEMIREADLGGNGYINIDDFVRIIEAGI